MKTTILWMMMLALIAASGRAEGQTATLTGQVRDDTEAAVAQADISVVNEATGLVRQARSRIDGSFIVLHLPPGAYTLRAVRAGFGPVEMPGLVLGTNEHLAVQLRLRVAPLDEVVTVASVPQAVSVSPATGRTIPRTLIEHTPLNGRSFHALLELTPGVVLFRSGATSGDGQFSVNGQRTNANYFTVDGVSANAGINPRNALTGESATGASPALSVLGTTSNLVAVDALEEFQVQTSSFAPEFGRSPGAQVSMTTRSGTNRYRGSAFEYFRDDAFDANDWFANARRLPKPALRQHDVGGVFGGPLRRDRAFFFTSYERLALDQPQTVLAAVPSAAARAAAPAATRPLLDAFPLPTGQELAAGTAEFAASYSDPVTAHATSLRLDVRGGQTLVFGRAAWAPSSGTTRTLSRLADVAAASTVVTGGLTRSFGNASFIDVRANWTGAKGESASRADDFGGAVRVPIAQLFPAFMDPARDNAIVTIGTLTYRDGQQTANRQQQVNFVATATREWRTHTIRTGLDFRQMRPEVASNGTFQMVFAGVPQAAAGTLTQAIVNSGAPPRVGRIDNWSVFLQDTWRAGSRLTVTYGLRWELAPAPGEASGQAPATVTGYRNQATMALAPEGTPVWDLGAGAVAPRVGAAYQMSRRPGRESVLRGGVGLFHNALLGPVGNIYGVFPYSRQQIVRNVTYPSVVSTVAAAPVDRLPPYGQIWAYADDLVLPRTTQWNLTVEQALGARQTVSAGYVGARGADLLRTTQILANAAVNPLFGSVVNLVDNSGRSTYHALQVQWTRRFGGRWSGLAAYTLGRSFDNTSADSSTVAGQTSGTAAPGGRLDPESDWGPSDFDLRHQFSGGVSVDGPRTRPGWLGAVVNGWSVDALVRARSALPITVVSAADQGFGFYNFRPDLVPSVPVWIDDPAVGGGRRLNRSAFVVPTGRQGTLGRNRLRGFNASQVDLAVRREFVIAGRATLALRVETFNLLNRPNFADPQPNLASPQFGLSTQMLSRGLGGLNPLYQMGGPRSSQLSLRVTF